MFDAVMNNPLLIPSCRYDDGGEQARDMLLKLQDSLLWEVRSLYFVLFGVAVRALSTMADDRENRRTIEDLGHQLLEYAVLQIMFTDAYFSVVVTIIFIRPISEVLRSGPGKNKSAGFRDLERTMYMTLAGSIMAVFSSTVLYLNLLVFFNGKYDILENAFLNPLVFAGKNIVLS